MKRAALIGLGMVAETHVAALDAAKNARLAAVCGRDASKAARFAKTATHRTGEQVSVFSNVTDVARSADIDFCIVATPPDARLKLIETLVEYGKPVLVEKPLERTMANARRIADMCAAARVRLGVVFQHRAREQAQRLKDLVDAGKLGKPVHAEVRVPWWRDQTYYDAPGRGTYARDGGGVMITQAIHTLDLLLWLLGPLSRVQASMRCTDADRLEAEDWAAAIFETAGGCFGTITATTAAFPGSGETLHIHGTDASALLEAGRLTISYRDGTSQILGEHAASGGGADPMAFTHGWHQSVIENFSAALDTGAAPLATGSDALRPLAVIEAMERASKSGTWEAVSTL